jgi:hypothetical protein
MTGRRYFSDKANARIDGEHCVVYLGKSGFEDGSQVAIVNL